MVDEGKITDAERQTHEHWFGTLPPARKSEIIKPHFEEVHPTDADKRKAAIDAGVVNQKSTMLHDDQTIGIPTAFDHVW